MTLAWMALAWPQDTETFCYTLGAWTAVIVGGSKDLRRLSDAVIADHSSFSRNACDALS